MPTTNTRQSQKDGAVELALLIYDMFKEQETSDRIEGGQNGANQNNNN